MNMKKGHNMYAHVYGQHDENTLEQFKKCLSVGSAYDGVLCADGHLGYAHPIGGVVGYTDHISISGVGFDIACGNMAVRTDLRFDDLGKPQISKILQDISKVISFGVGRKNSANVKHALFDMNDLWDQADVRSLKNLAHEQLGTVGSGNHYVDLLVDTKGFVWVGVHFGSRGLGHKITTKYLKAVDAKDGMMVDPALLDVNSDLGRGYLAGIELGGLYAYAGREWVVQTVVDILGAHVTDTVHNHHNFAWKETHFGQEMWVVRKGATPAFPNQRGFVGGSMGDNAVIIRGVESEKSAESMYSTVHGAGRVMSRTDARGKVNRKTGEVIRAPMVSRDDWKRWIEEFDVQVIGADLDESPQAYRRLDEVLTEHAGTINIEETLKPFGVLMAGSDEFDPYKD